MDILKKHVDTVFILGGILGACLWMNGKFNSIEKDIAIVKAVLVIHKIMPPELAAKEKNQ